MKFTFGDQDLKDSQYFPFEGRFLVALKKFEVKPSQAGNNVLHMEFQGLGENRGQTGKEFITLLPNQMWKLAGLFKAAGFSKDHLKEEGGDPSALIGKPVFLVRSNATKEMYNGKERTNYESRFEAPVASELEGVELPYSEAATESDVPDFGTDDVAV